MERMLLSHNFNLAQGELTMLEREEFAQVFIDGFQAEDRINCKLIDNAEQDFTTGFRAR